MTTRRQLFSIEYHSVDKDSEGSSAYYDGEVEWCITKELRPFIEKYGYEGIKNIMAELGGVIHEMIDFDKRLLSNPEKNCST
jgi:hypothetical protein